MTIALESPPRAADILDQVKAIGPEIAARSAEIEASRRVPSDLLERLKAAGCFRLTLPASHGGAEADLVTAIPMTNAHEAIGVARAARAAGMPVVISFTVETDGKLPTGQPLQEALQEVDAATGQAPLYYMINCAHPSHFEGVLDGQAWMARLRRLRANAPKCSHAELDEAAELDDGDHLRAGRRREGHDGDPVERGHQYRDLCARFPQFNVLGGCCGTDHRHIEQIGTACTIAA